MGSNIASRRAETNSARHPRFLTMLNAWSEEFEPLWITGVALGLVVVTVLLVRHQPTLSVKARDWIVYGVFGTVFPLFLVALTPFSQLPSGIRLGQRIVRLSSACTALIAAVVIAARAVEWFMIIPTVAQLAMGFWLLRSMGVVMQARTVVLLTMVTLLAWMAAARFIWLAPFSRWMFGSLYSAMVFGGVLALVTAVVLVPAAWVRPAPGNALGPVFTVMSLFVLLAASMRTAPPFKTFEGAYVHWGAFTGPALTVREGGWLLWDVPAQYGFLSTLAVAFFPAPNVWQSLYILNVVFVFLGAALLFLALRALQPGGIGTLFALVTTFAVTFLVSGTASVVVDNVERPYFLGANSLPSVGAFRFVWCYVLLTVLIWEAREEARGTGRWLIPVAGSLIWLVGCFWSVESAAYCTAIWLPAYVLLTLRRWRGTESGERSSAVAAQSRWAFAWLMLPPTLLVVACGGLIVYYRMRLGHAPDAWMYVEAIFTYSVGDFSLPVILNGAVTGLFAVFCALSTVVVAVLRRGLMHREFPLAVGAWGGLWATSSYCFGRSAQTSLTNVAPLICGGIVIALLIVKQWDIQPIALAVRMALIPMLVASIAFAFGDFATVQAYATEAQRGYLGHFERELPTLTDEQAQLLDTAGVKPSDPIVLFDVQTYTVMPARSTPGKMLPNGIQETESTLYVHPWLPLIPFIAPVAIQHERSATFVDRYAARIRHGGWILQRKAQPYQVFAVMATAIDRDYKATRTLERGEWQLVYFEYRVATRDQASTCIGMS